MAEDAAGSIAGRFRGWLRERAALAGRERCPYCRSTPLRSTAEMVVFTNRGYRFPNVALTYCLLCEQLLSAHLADDEPLCHCGSHLESDIAESDTLPLRNPHRITDIVFSSCAACGQVHEARVHY
ncbi:MAG TPA: hypothetical protein VG245_00590 [Candidatus Dormibacteraeota bacterium]|jgi:hypothetical protein|nr:hypothetical protein [Candidatus Dormibacteraeota bacterium]